MQLGELPRLIALIAGGSARILKCDICGAGFECRGLRGCWCSQAEVSKDRLREIRRLASDCVCPNCLSGEKDKKIPVRDFFK